MGAAARVWASDPHSVFFETFSRVCFKHQVERRGGGNKRLLYLNSVGGVGRLVSWFRCFFFVLFFCDGEHFFLRYFFVTSFSSADPRGAVGYSASAVVTL